LIITVSAFNFGLHSKSLFLTDYVLKKLDLRSSFLPLWRDICFAFFKNSSNSLVWDADNKENICSLWTIYKWATLEALNYL